MIKIRLVLSAPPIFLYSAFMALWIVISGLGLVTRKPKLHAVYAPMFLVVLIVWVSYVIPGFCRLSQELPDKSPHWLPGVPCHGLGIVMNLEMREAEY